MKSKSKFEDHLVVWSIPAAFLILFTIYIATSISTKKLQPFLDSYLQQYTLPEETAGSKATRPETVRAIVISPVDTKNQSTDGLRDYKVSPLTLKLPSRIRAKTSAEVNVIILVEETNVTQGSYSDGQPAYRKKMEVTIIDARINEILSRNSFIGGDPPVSKSSSSPGYGSSPQASVLKWIRTVLNWVVVLPPS